MLKIEVSCRRCRVASERTIEDITPEIMEHGEPFRVPEGWRSVCGYLLCAGCTAAWEGERREWVWEWIRMAHLQRIETKDGDGHVLNQQGA